MNGRRVRRGGYGHQRWRTVLIIVLSAVLLLMIVFLIVGARLFDKLNQEEETAEGSKKTVQTTAEPFAIPNPRAVHGYALELQSLQRDALLQRLEEIAGLGGDTVTVRMTDAEGRLLYGSALSLPPEYIASGASSVSFESMVSYADRAGLYVSGVMSLRSAACEDDLEREVMAAYEVAMICEAIRAGMDEVILRWDASAADLFHLERLVKDVRALQPEAVIGFATEVAYYSGESAAVRMEALCRSFDFFCLSVSAEFGESSPAEYVAEVLKQQNYHILRYRMRVLLPGSLSAEEQAVLATTMQEHHIAGWQFYLP